ncbi:uncharacterized protein MEPE_04209 [Melanopsichium pennsylvanicum]|uniref:F-box domain-containing protein n=2 Tax=Melanopsichium pennsylvanicum TaxID=63383 RepID=A0AAJ5C668_9BASI|nr:nucleolar rna methyltransferase [Melanopsichium pennsylvanicum 4]SNX85500.1 uncharacterized protein MEPE_04209 [Melanopsichium pennsylvanicum]
MSLKLDSDDITLHYRTAVVLIEERRYAQASACLDTAGRLATQLSYAVKQMWLEKLKVQRFKLNFLIPCYINRLPNELLVRLAQFLEVGDRLTMSQTCTTWRDVILTPCLWAELVINIKQGPKTATSLTKKQAVKWLSHIQICAQRSGHSLKRVQIGGPFPEQLLQPVLSILRQSAQSLVSIELPALDQERCYSLLYRYCPNLTTLNVKYVGLIPIQSDGTFQFKLKCQVVKDSPQDVNETFLLEHFTGGDKKKHPGLAKHLCCIRVLDSYNPYILGTLRPEPTPIEVQHEEPWSRIVDSLEEWRIGPHWPSSGILAREAERQKIHRPYERTLPIRLTFSKLVKLEAYRLDQNLHFTFPQLRQLLRLELGKDNDHEFWSKEFGRILETSPLLEKIDMKLYDRQSVRNDWVMAMRGLQHLEELHLNVSANPDIVVLLLLPRATEDAQGLREVEFPVPKLRRLVMTGWLPGAMRLVKILAMRNRLRDGLSLYEAREWALHRLEPVIHHMRSAEFFPLQQERDIAPAWPHLEQMEEDPAYKVKEPQRCFSLDTIELRQLREDPVQYEKTLREMVPNVVMKYVNKRPAILY